MVYHHIRFNTFFSCLHVLSSFSWKISKHLSVSYVLTFFFQITYDYLLLCFFGRPLEKLLLILKVLHLLDQTLSSILSKWLNHYSLSSCKHFLMLFNFILVISSSAETLVSGLTLQSHLIILAWFLPNLITPPSLTGQISSWCNITLLGNLCWQTKALNLWTYTVHSWSF